jgi:hypothetical protein
MTDSNVLAAVERELAYYPGVQMKAQNRGKHRRLLFERGGESRFLTVPITASDWRAPKNAVRDFHKTMRELGALRIGPPQSQPIKKRRASPGGPAICKITLNDKILQVHFPATSKLVDRFRDKNARPTGHWKISLTPSPDLQAPPMVSVKRVELPPGAAKHKGFIAGYAPTPTSGAWRLTVSRSLFPALKAVPEIKTVGVALYHDGGDEMIFQFPPETVPTGFVAREPDPETEAPEPIEAPETGLAEPEPTPAAEAKPEPTNGLRDQPIVLQFPKQAVSVEQAIAILNKAKARLGFNLRFTIEEGGFLSAVHRIGK